MENELQKRLFEFIVRVIKFLRTLPNTQENYILKNQLIKSSTSTGANYEESQAASSKADFTYKVEISLKEMRESNFWLRLIQSISIDEKIEINELEYLIKESNELKLILGKIVYKSKNKTKNF